MLPEDEDTVSNDVPGSVNKKKLKSYMNSLSIIKSSDFQTVALEHTNKLNLFVYKM